MSKVQIKICGISCIEDVDMMNTVGVEYAGIVCFYPKSKRNQTMESAKILLQKFDSSIQTVAVTVSPSLEQVNEISEAGFDIIQVHGELREEVLEQREIPIFRALNISDEQNIRVENHEHIIGYVLDGRNPGSGKTFNWSKLRSFQTEKLFILAGGLNEGNVQEGMKQLDPDIVDVSTGVEYLDGHGKDPIKVQQFVSCVRQNGKSK